MRLRERVRARVRGGESERGQNLEYRFVYIHIFFSYHLYLINRYHLGLTYAVL